MKINWKLRLKNKTTLLALITCGCTFVYQVLGLLGLTQLVTEDMMIQLAGAGLNILVTLGVVIDPTTEGVMDGSKALSYKEPRSLEN